MQDILKYFIIIVLLIGAFLIGVSYTRIQRLMMEIQKDELLKQWRILSAPILFLGVGYLAYAFLNWEVFAGNRIEVAAPALFFLSAVLIFLIGALALETAIEFSRMSRLERENIMDHLTGVYNRRYLDKKIASEAIRARRYDMPLSIMMIDIDHFKAVNDRYGHQTGDQILKNLGGLLLRKVRATDVVARYGGEEIAILSLQTKIRDASDLAERLRQAIESSVMVPADHNEYNVDIRITVSIGVSGFDQDVFDSQTMIKEADMALYQAKREGRNRVIVYQR